MRTVAALSLAAALTGCASVDTYTMQAPLPDWPTMTVREHPGQSYECWKMASPARKLWQVVMLAPPVACAWVNLCERTVDIYYPSLDHCAALPHDDLGCMASRAARGHELRHAKGELHPANLVGNEHYEYWRAGKCEAK